MASAHDPGKSTNDMNIRTGFGGDAEQEILWQPPPLLDWHDHKCLMNVYHKIAMITEERAQRRNKGHVSGSEKKEDERFGLGFY